MFFYTSMQLYGNFHVSLGSKDTLIQGNFRILFAIPLTRYLAMKHMATCKEMSMYFAICFFARNMEISMYLAICFILRYMRYIVRKFCAVESEAVCLLLGIQSRAKYCSLRLLTGCGKDNYEKFSRL